MTQTTNYDLNLVEGTDKVNPLTQMNPNFEKIDEEMKKNADSGITVATELLTGSIHGLLRTNADCSMLRFTATSNYTAGDTFTVDGIQVTALTPTGEALATGAYIIGSEVLGCLKGTLLTLFIGGGTVTTADNALKLGGEEPEYYGKAADVTQAQQTATAAGVLANSVQTQVTSLNDKINKFGEIKQVSSVAGNVGLSWNYVINETIEDEGTYLVEASIEMVANTALNLVGYDTQSGTNVSISTYTPFYSGFNSNAIVTNVLHLKANDRISVAIGSQNAHTNTNSVVLKYTKIG